MNTLTPRAAALTLAWQIIRTARLPFVKAQAQAWATIKLKARMQTGLVAFFYIKDDGTTRFAVGHHTGTPATTSHKNTGRSKTTSPLVIPYYDTLANGLRSFRADRLLID